MKVLVANLGSTSFKYRLFELPAMGCAEGGRDGERELARGGVERIGAEESRVYSTLGNTERESLMPVPDHAVALQAALAQLTGEGGAIASIDEVAAIGFKAVHGGRVTGVVRVSSDVLAAMEEVSHVAPAHNPPYVRAMRLLSERLPHVPLVAAFETGFHSTIPERNALYAVPTEWVEKYHVRRWGFHGASHRYVASRLADAVPKRPLRAISCHLGGSSSVCCRAPPGFRGIQQAWNGCDTAEANQTRCVPEGNAALVLLVLLLEQRWMAGGAVQPLLARVHASVVRPGLPWRLRAVVISKREAIARFVPCEDIG